MAQHPALCVQNLSVSYGEQRVLSDVSIDLAQGESLAVVGRSGSGKTTLLLTILGLVAPDSGIVRVSGRDMTHAPARMRARIRRELIGAVFQSGELLPELTALENVTLPALLDQRPSEEARRRGKELLDRLGVRAVERRIGTYSGGEQQRVAVARALINAPELIVADEPTGSLDLETAEEVQDLLFELPKHYGCALVLVTHDRALAARAHGVLEMARSQDRLAKRRCGRE